MQDTREAMAALLSLDFPWQRNFGEGDAFKHKSFRKKSGKIKKTKRKTRERKSKH